MRKARGPRSRARPRGAPLSPAGRPHSLFHDPSPVQVTAAAPAPTHAQRAPVLPSSLRASPPSRPPSLPLWARRDPAPLSVHEHTGPIRCGGRGHREDPGVPPRAPLCPSPRTPASRGTSLCRPRARGRHSGVCGIKKLMNLPQKKFNVTLTCLPWAKFKIPD